MPLKLGIAVFLCLLAFPILASTFEGQLDPAVTKDLYEPLTLEKVVDGDTFYASGLKIRLWGVDAPERDEEMYELSSKALQLFIEEAELKCKQVDTDKYKRAVMHCYVNDTDLGGLMVKAGFATDYTRYSGGFYQREETFAKGAKLGLWK